jgi:sphinganine-1-phosphate aldolase
LAADIASRVDVFALGDALAQRGWYHDRQSPPDSLHSTVSNGNAASIDAWIADLHECIADVRGTTTDDRSTTYSTVE